MARRRKKKARSARRKRKNVRPRKRLAARERTHRRFAKKRGWSRTRHKRTARRMSRRLRLISKPFLIRARSKSTPGKVYDRLATVIRVDGQNLAFYQSTGTGGGSKKGDWVPFNGISRRGGGWFIKIPGKLPTGRLRRAAVWLRGRRKKPTRIFDEADYSTAAAWNADINHHIDSHGALYRKGGGPFNIGTVNVR